MPDKPWYLDAFGEEYSVRYRHRSEEAAQREVAFVWPRLDVSRGDLVLDLGCGNGRHARAMLDRGARVIGMDASEPLLREAANHGKCGRPAYVRADMRRIPLRVSVAAVTSFFTSFGYFDSDQEDLLVLRETRRVLRPGGRFLLDFLNADQVRTQLVPVSERREGGWNIRERRALSKDQRRVEKMVTMERSGTTRQFTESVRLYDRAELTTMLQRSGLLVLREFGDLAGSAFAETAARLVLFCQRGSD